MKVIKRLMVGLLLASLALVAFTLPVKAASQETITVATDSDTAPFTYKKDKIRVCNVIIMRDAYIC